MNVTATDVRNAIETLTAAGYTVRPPDDDAEARIAAALALHQPNQDRRCVTCRDDYGDLVSYPCDTAQSLGVEP